MAIDTDNKKLTVMEWGIPWEPGLPLSPGTLGYDDKQQLLWGYSGILWSIATVDMWLATLYINQDSNFTLYINQDPSFDLEL